MSNLERKFSQIFSQIVEDENDMIGHIAYSIYKANKVEYIKSFSDQNNGNIPTEDDLEKFHLSIKTTLPALRIQAEQLLTNFIQFTLGETVNEIEQEVKNEQLEMLSSIVQPLIPPKPKGPWDGFWMSVLVKSAQALVVAIIFFLIIFGASAKDDFWGTIRKMLPEPTNHEQIKSAETSKHVPK